MLINSIITLNTLILIHYYQQISLITSILSSNMIIKLSFPDGFAYNKFPEIILRNYPFFELPKKFEIEIMLKLHQRRNAIPLIEELTKKFFHQNRILNVQEKRQAALEA